MRERIASLLGERIAQAESLRRLLKDTEDQLNATIGSIQTLEELLGEASASPRTPCEDNPAAPGAPVEG